MFLSQLETKHESSRVLYRTTEAETFIGFPGIAVLLLSREIQRILTHPR
jgi:hypothetical protein